MSQLDLEDILISRIAIISGNRKTTSLTKTYKLGNTTGISWPVGNSQSFIPLYQG